MPKYKLPPDPCRMLGGTRKKKKDTKPMPWSMQVTRDTRARRRKRRIEKTVSYKTKRIREFLRDESDRDYFLQFGGYNLYTGKKS